MVLNLNIFMIFLHFPKFQIFPFILPLGIRYPKDPTLREKRKKIPQNCTGCLKLLADYIKACLRMISYWFNVDCATWKVHIPELSHWSRSRPLLRTTTSGDAALSSIAPVLMDYYLLWGRNDLAQWDALCLDSGPFRSPISKSEPLLLPGTER